MSLLNEIDAKRFDSRVYHEANTGCWLWGGAVSSMGYGNAYAGVNGERKQWAAHRLSWIRHNGRVPERTEFVCHTCDTPACVNPDHLFLGTPKENTQDMMRKGRRVAPVIKNRACGERHGSKTKPERLKRGSAHHQAKITESDVLDIRASKEPLSALSKRYGMTPTTLSKVRRGLLWRHV